MHLAVHAYLVFLLVLQGAHADWTLPVLPAPTNYGLKPTRLEAYGHTHYWQLAEGAKAGTVVRLPAPLAPAAPRPMGGGKTLSTHVPLSICVPPQVLIHGCGRQANSFWPTDPAACPECNPLPEHVAQTKQALARGYSVLALSPNDVGSKCWSSSSRNGRVDDRPHVSNWLAG